MVAIFGRLPVCSVASGLSVAQPLTYCAFLGVILWFLFPVLLGVPRNLWQGFVTLRSY
jgi:hypothetical protein